MSAGSVSYCKQFNVLFHPQKVPLSAFGLLFTGGSVGLAFPLPQVVGSRKYTYINPGSGRGEMSVPSLCSCVNSPRGDSLKLRIKGKEGCCVQGLPTQGAPMGVLQNSERGGEA